MSLALFEPEWAEVHDGKGRLLAKVRGLNTTDLSILVRAHGPALRQIYEDSQQGDSALADIAKTAGIVMVQEPVVAFTIIALASDEPEKIADVGKWPAPLVIKVLIEVLRLTVEDIGGPLALADLAGRLLAVLPQGVLPGSATIQ